jgi:hypothetical protein
LDTTLFRDSGKTGFRFSVASSQQTTTQGGGSIGMLPLFSIGNRRDSIHFATFAEKGRNIEILLLEIGDHGLSDGSGCNHVS